jgi:hypothetical protein
MRKLLHKYGLCFLNGIIHAFLLDVQNITDDNKEDSFSEQGPALCLTHVVVVLTIRKYRCILYEYTSLKFNGVGWSSLILPVYHLAPKDLYTFHTSEQLHQVKCFRICSLSFCGYLVSCVLTIKPGGGSPFPQEGYVL